MDRLTSAQVLVEAIDRGSISAAAAALGMSRAMASRHIENLEEWLGARLLHRTTRALAVTDAGSKAVPGFRAMLELLDDVRGQAGQQGVELRGKLRLTTTASFAEAQLAAAVIDFQDQHPRIEIDLLVLDRPVNLVAERIDLAVRITNHLDEGLVARRLATCHSVLCASPGYLGQRGMPAQVADLKDHHFVSHDGLAAAGYQVTDQLTMPPSQKLHGFTRIATNETAVVRALALANAGIAILPTYYIRADLAAGSLIHVLPDHSPPSLGIHAVFASRRNQPKALQMLIAHLVARFGGQPAPWDMAALS
ncbi:LysR family transcriptional regulator [Stenotrophomonas tuberculopleuritidis]|uniref:LysR family transcriptional regulator n=1 Tax=Stenotrophomonas tuberculopleuritidis TaxID=3055079 RepID=UPI0026E51700|nr:LysR family transcriptional regulator [Stenotrophomonas sp. 704A1]